VLVVVVVDAVADLLRTMTELISTSSMKLLLTKAAASSRTRVCTGISPKLHPPPNRAYMLFLEKRTSCLNHGNTIKIVLPTANRGQYMNTRQSYLKSVMKKLYTTPANTLILENSEHTLIRSQKVSASGGACARVLEHIEKFNAMNQALIDVSGYGNQVVCACTIADGFNQFLKFLYIVL
jgi:hypothetical protein